MDVQQGGLCFYCGQPLGAHTATYDHLIPLSHGGADVTGNVVLAHRRCNALKADRLPSPDAIERFVAMRKGSRLGVWPPLLTAIARNDDADPWQFYHGP